MEGKIIKGIAGFYYVHTEESGIYECKAKGIFRKEKIKPMVGDNVTIDIIDEADKKGNISDILSRKNQLIRPVVSNIDQALLIFSVAKPAPNFNLLDRFLVMMEKQHIDTILCFNKKDIGTEKEMDLLCNIYTNCGYEAVFASAKDKEGLDKIYSLLKGKTTTVAGPSGVGKSSLINILQPEAGMETGEISEKIQRGRHTTRHSELIHIKENTYIVDTPGFSSLHLMDITKEELKYYFREFSFYEPYCKFQGCDHIHEPECGVKRALEEQKLSKIRYQSYLDIYNELKEQRRY